MTEPKRGPGQPRIGSEHKITIPDDDWLAMAAIAIKKRISVAAVVRDAISKYLNRKDHTS